MGKHCPFNMTVETRETVGQISWEWDMEMREELEWCWQWTDLDRLEEKSHQKEAALNVDIWGENTAARHTQAGDHNLIKEQGQDREMKESKASTTLQNTTRL